MSEAIQETVRVLRKRHGLTQTELAEIAGVSLPSLCRFENGKTTIRLDVLVKILAALGLELTTKRSRREAGVDGE